MHANCCYFTVSDIVDFFSRLHINLNLWGLRDHHNKLHDVTDIFVKLKWKKFSFWVFTLNIFKENLRQN